VDAAATKPEVPLLGIASATAPLVRTNTGSLVDGADTAALLLAADVNLANGGAEPTRPVAGARVLHRRGGRAAIAASVGVTSAVPVRSCRGTVRPRVALPQRW
jgi:hypothetical protein